MTDVAPQIDNLAARQAAVPKEAAQKVEAARASRLTPAEQERSAKAKIYRTAVENSTDPSDARSLADVLAKPNIPDQSRVAGAIEGKIGTNVDASTGLKTPTGPEQARIDSAKNAEVILRGIMESGTLPADLTPLVKSMNPLIDSIYTDPPLNARQREQFIRDVVKDPNVRKKLQARYSQVLAIPMPDILAAQRASLEASGRFSVASKEVVDTDAKLNDTIRESGKRATATKLRVYESANLEARLAAVQQEMNKLHANWDAAATTADKDKIQRDIDSRQLGLADLQDQISDRNRLRDLPQEIQRLQLASENSKGKLEIAAGERSLADVALSEAKGARVDAENQLVEGLQDGLTDAVVAQIDENIEKVRVEGAQKLQEEANTAKTELERQMALRTANKYITPTVDTPGTKGKFRRWRVTGATKAGDFEVNGVRAAADIEHLIRQNGPGTPELVREQLAEIFKDPATGVVDQASVDKAMSDPNFVSEWGAKLGKSAMEAFAQTGGIITAGQAQYIEAQPWGADLVQQAVASPEVAKAEALLAAEKKLPPGGFKEFIKTREGKAFLAIILGLAAGAVLPAMVPAMMMSQGGGASH